MLSSVTIQPVAGINYVQNAMWAFIKVILVAVDDAVYDLRNAPGNLKCQYIPAEGKILFQNDFNGTSKVILLLKSATALT